MTLYEALQDIGKGRFYDTGCDWDCVALAKGTYTFEFHDAPTFTITLDGKQGDNARMIEKEFYKHCDKYPLAHFYVTCGLTYKHLKPHGAKKFYNITSPSK